MASVDRLTPDLVEAASCTACGGVGMKALVEARTRAVNEQAEVERLRGSIAQARDLLAEAYDPAEHDDSPGNMAFAVLNAALGEEC